MGLGDWLGEALGGATISALEGSKRKHKDKSGLKGVLILLLLPVLGFAGYWGYQQWRVGPFSGRLDAFLDAKEARSLSESDWPIPKPGMESVPNVFMAKVAKGPVLVIDTDARSVDEIHFGLPGEWRAATPDEVGMLVLLSQRKRAGDPNELIWRLAAFDWKTKRLVGRTTIGGLPLDKEKPSTKIIEIIGRLRG